MDDVKCTDGAWRQHHDCSSLELRRISDRITEQHRNEAITNQQRNALYEIIVEASHNAGAELKRQRAAFDVQAQDVRRSLYRKLFPEYMCAGMIDRDYGAAIHSFEMLRDPGDKPEGIHLLPDDLSINMRGFRSVVLSGRALSPKLSAHFWETRGECVEVLKRSRVRLFQQVMAQLDGRVAVIVAEQRARMELEYAPDEKACLALRNDVESGFARIGELSLTMAHAKLACKEAQLRENADALKVSSSLYKFCASHVDTLRAVVADLSEIRPSVEDCPRRLYGLLGECAVWWWAQSRGSSVQPLFIRYRCSANVRWDIVGASGVTLSNGDDTGPDIEIDRMPVEVRTRHRQTEAHLMRYLDPKTLARKIKHSRRVLWVQYWFEQKAYFARVVGWNELVPGRTPSEEPMEPLSKW